MHMRARRSLDDRFWSKVDKSAGLFSCWPWLGAINQPSLNGRYRRTRSPRPVFRVNTICTGPGQIVVYAARMALSLTDGVPLAERHGFEACHRVECSNIVCVNPAHLYWGTPDQNREDRYGEAAKRLREQLGSLTG